MKIKSLSHIVRVKTLNSDMFEEFTANTIIQLNEKSDISDAGILFTQEAALLISGEDKDLFPRARVLILEFDHPSGVLSLGTLDNPVITKFESQVNSLVVKLEHKSTEPLL